MHPTPFLICHQTKVLYLAGLGKLEALIQLAGDDPGSIANCRDYDDRTALHLAVSEGWEEVAKWLMDHGAEINAVDRWKGTPLQDAIRTKRTRLIEQMVARCAAPPLPLPSPPFPLPFPSCARSL